MQTNWPNSGSIKIDIFWMSRFEFQSKFCNLSLVLGDRMHLALFKKIRILYGLLHLLTHSPRSKLTWSSPNPVKMTTTLRHMARVMSPNFLKKCQMQPISQDQWQIAKFILEFKSTHPKCVNFNGVRAGSIFFAIRLIVVQCALHCVSCCTKKNILSRIDFIDLSLYEMWNIFLPGCQKH